MTSLELFEAAENAALVGDIMTRVMLTCELGSITREALRYERICWYTQAQLLLSMALDKQTADIITETLAYNV